MTNLRETQNKAISTMYNVHDGRKSESCKDSFDGLIFQLIFVACNAMQPFDTGKMISWTANGSKQFLIELRQE